MEEKVVISLSTIPPRYKSLGNPLKCLLDQDYPVDEIQVYIPRVYRRFPEHAFCIPEVPPGISIKIVDEDLGPATKVLYCAKAHWGSRTRIVYCDDDRLPQRTWLTSLIEASKKFPEKTVVGHGWHIKVYGFSNSETRLPRAVWRGPKENIDYMRRRFRHYVREKIRRKSFPKPHRKNFKKNGYVDIAGGCGGVSIKPEFFDKSAFEIPTILWPIDDIWLSGMLEIRDIGIWVDNSIPVPRNQFDSGIASLSESVFEEYESHFPDEYGIRYFQDAYSIWL